METFVECDLGLVGLFLSAIRRCQALGKDWFHFLIH